MWPQCWVRGAPLVVKPPPPGLRLVEQVRAGLRRAVADRQPEPRALVPALLGDTSSLDGSLAQDFQSTGLTHLTAVSGANLTLLLAFLLTVARWVGVRAWWLRVLGLAGVIIFVALCRTEPSVLRAAAMGWLLGRAGLQVAGQPGCATGVASDLAAGGSVSSSRSVRAVGFGLRRHRVVGPKLGSDHERWLPDRAGRSRYRLLLGWRHSGGSCRLRARERCRFGGQRAGWSVHGPCDRCWALPLLVPR